MEEWLKHDSLLTFIGLLGAAGAFLVGLSQYRHAQRWKRVEWTAQEMKSLFADPLVQAVLLMIDYSDHHFIPLYPNRINPDEQTVRVRDVDVALALAHHATRGPFTRTEADIRSAFDRLLDGIERAHSYVASGLVVEADHTVPEVLGGESVPTSSRAAGIAHPRAAEVHGRLRVQRRTPTPSTSRRGGVMKLVSTALLVFSLACARRPPRMVVVVPGSVPEPAELTALIEASLNRASACSDPEVLRRAALACSLKAPRVVGVRESQRNPEAIEVSAISTVTRNEYWVTFSRSTGEWIASDVWLVDE